MITLKDYQLRSLDSLSEFFQQCGQFGPKMAFIGITERPYHPVPHLNDVPYICLRVPTGGGKTIMACHALGLAGREYLQSDKAVCLWLVPSNAILDQTLSALRNREHPYRQALESRFSTPISVMTLKEALSVQRGTLMGETVVIVSTLAALRVEDTEGRKVYETNGALDHHFNGLSPRLEELLEKDESGVYPKSLANVLRLNQPVVVMDEAHNARTTLSFATLERFNPSCILEFTATPETTHKPESGYFASNVLHHVSAAELKAEDMIKLPIHLRTRSDWKEAVADAIKTQGELESAALAEEKESGEYIRPIVLLQAQSKSKNNDTITVEILEEELKVNFKIPEAQIAVATGTTRDLDDVDLFDRDCPIRYIITVQALKEGWDCSFAYVLCTVSEVSTPKSVEQILGRILRLPHAKRKMNEVLNCAQAIATSSNFLTTAGNLEKALIENGFQALEAEDLIQPASTGSIFSPASFFDHITQPVSAAPKLDKLPDPLRERVTYDEETKTLTVKGIVSDDDRDVLKGAFSSKKDKDTVDAIYGVSQMGIKRNDTPAARGESFAIPRLGIKDDTQLHLFDMDGGFLDHSWELSKKDMSLSEQEFPSTYIAGKSATIDIDAKGHVEYGSVERLREQISLLNIETGWTVAELANWIDRQIPHPDIVWEQASLYIHGVIDDLMKSRAISVDALARQRFRLRNAIANRIAQYRSDEAKKAYNTALFGGQASVSFEVSADISLVLNEDAYAPSWYYEGGYKFTKHYFGPRKVGELKSEGEEFDCAAYIDMMPEVKYWVRNLERHERTSFWLPTSTDRFYPDFIAILNDGRILVIEYKGGDRWSNDDSKEKRAIGELWADKGGDYCLFVMPKGPDWAAIDGAIA